GKDRPPLGLTRRDDAFPGQPRAFAQIFVAAGADLCSGHPRNSPAVGVAKPAIVYVCVKHGSSEKGMGSRTRNLIIGRGSIFIHDKPPRVALAPRHPSTYPAQPSGIAASTRFFLRPQPENFTQLKRLFDRTETNTGDPLLCD